MDSYSGKTVLTFYSHHEAVRQKRKLSDAGLKSTLIPVPRALSSSCGTALLAECTDIDRSLLTDGVESVCIKKEEGWSVSHIQ